MSATDHASLAVSDLDAGVRFYVTAFGYDELFRDAHREAIAALTGVPGLSCSLAQLRHPDGGVLELVAFAGVPEGGEDTAPVRVGHGHVAFRVGDLDATLARVRAEGAAPLGGTVTFATGRAVYVREPAGSVFELYEPAA